MLYLKSETVITLSCLPFFYSKLPPILIYDYVSASEYRLFWYQVALYQHSHLTLLIYLKYLPIYSIQK